MGTRTNIFFNPFLPPYLSSMANLNSNLFLIGVYESPKHMFSNAAPKQIKIYCAFDWLVGWQNFSEKKVWCRYV